MQHIHGKSDLWSGKIFLKKPENQKLKSFVFSFITTPEIFNLCLPTKVVTSPSFPGLSGKDIHKVVLYFLICWSLFSPLSCQYFLIADLALPVLVIESQRSKEKKMPKSKYKKFKKKAGKTGKGKSYTYPKKKMK